DGEHIVLGSQNFTYQGRKNREVSFAAKTMTHDSRFLQTLHQWADSAEPIDMDLLNFLERRIAPLAKRFSAARAEIEAELEASVVELARLNEAEHGRKLDEQ